MTAPDPRPSPLVPPETDLTSVPSMLLDVRRFLNSDLATETDPGAAFFAVVLWCEAWHQRPAASLPATDTALCKLAGFGRDQASWQRVREVAMRGWVLCGDGRHYHPVVAEKALEAWVMHLRYRKRSAAGNASKYGANYNAEEYDEQIERAIAFQRRLADKYGLAAPKSPPSPAPQAQLPLGDPPAPPPPPQAPAPAPAAREKPAAKKRARNTPVADFGGASYGSAAFHEFWAVYPKAAGKKAAWDVWDRMKLDEFVEVIVADVKNRKTNCYRWREVQFVPDPERYLKNCRWNDAIVPYPDGKNSHIGNDNHSIARAWAGEET